MGPLHSNAYIFKDPVSSFSTEKQAVKRYLYSCTSKAKTITKEKASLHK